MISSNLRFLPKIEMHAISTALFRSLASSPRLILDLPEASAFSLSSLNCPAESTILNLRQKLGHIYEDALSEMLEATPAYDLVARGVQLREIPGHTIGELDFLIKELESHRLIHLELAVKFYLAIESSGGFLLPGPDARDDYFQKLDRMRSHQLVLLEKHRDLLPEKFHDEKIVTQQLVQGCIFDHIKSSKPVAAPYLNPLGRRGKWLHVDDCDNFFGNKTSLFLVPKPLWPVPFDTLDGIQLQKWTTDFAMDRCVMVRAESQTTPYFIVPNGYPNGKK